MLKNVIYVYANKGHSFACLRSSFSTGDRFLISEFFCIIREKSFVAFRPKEID